MRIVFLAVLAAGLSITSCSSLQNSSGDSGDLGESGPTYEREVSPFVLVGESGEEYLFPFLGGLNYPRPQFLDIDLDGDNDQFIQESSGRVMFFENTGTANSPIFTWRTDRFSDLDIGEWFRFVDMDGDGDFDLLTERRFSYIKYLRNDGGVGSPNFVLATETLVDSNGKALFSDRQNIPSLTDIDCDGNLDLFIGKLTGTVARYEMTSMSDDGVPIFDLVTDNFEGIEIVGAFAGHHGANTMAFGDVDDDGDQDLFWGDFFEPGLLFIENTGSCEDPDLTGMPQPFPTNEPLVTSGYNASLLADWDLDGDLDLFIGVLGGAFDANMSTVDNYFYFEQTPEGFKHRTTTFISNLDLGNETIPVLVDQDSDGDLDLYVSNKIEPLDKSTGRLAYFENTGTRALARFEYKSKMDLEEGYHFAPSFGDLDADGDLDMLLGSWSNSVIYFENQGNSATPNYVKVSDAIVTLTRGSNTTPDLSDVDGDGDLDLMVGETSGAMNFYLNDGTPEEPKFTLVSDKYGGWDIGRRSIPVFADEDNDGDEDLFIGSDVNGLSLYRNESGPAGIVFALDSTFVFDVPQFGTPTFGDIDADGDSDVIVGGVGGGISFFRNRKRP